MLGIQTPTTKPVREADCLPDRIAGSAATIGSYLLCEHKSAARREVEQFIRHSFARNHGANIRHFLPRLLSLHREDASLLAAFGIRPATTGRLFLETYLDQPIQTVLSQRLDQPITRQTIVEVGNLSARPGSTRLMIAALTALLYCEGFRWVAFTGTTQLHNSFLRLGLEPLTLCPAEKTRLPAEEQDGWGNYYDQKPCVFGGDIAHGLQLLLDIPVANAMLRRVRFPEGRT